MNKSEMRNQTLILMLMAVANAIENKLRSGERTDEDVYNAFVNAPDDEITGMKIILEKTYTNGASRMLPVLEKIEAERRALH